MEAFITPQVVEGLSEFINISKKDPHAEVECKLLAGRIQTKDIADRILSAIKTVSTGTETIEHRLSFSYKDAVRVSVLTPQNIQKLLVTNSFREVPLTVEKKQRYFENNIGKKDVFDIPDASVRFTLRKETPMRKDWEGDPNDPRGHVRLINRRSFHTPDELFRIDFSMVKTRCVNSKQKIREMLMKYHEYELEIEFVGKHVDMPTESIVKELFRILTILSQAFYETEFLLRLSDIQKYQEEFRMSGYRFYNIVTLQRRHLNVNNPHNIAKGYTVTNKADGQRSGLYVARDGKVLLISKNNLRWTGIVANDDSHIGDFIDGEYIAEKHLFCIFDVFRFRNKDTRSLPLMKTDEDTLKNPLNSRLGCARLFVEDIRSQFTILPALDPIRIETKLFLAGDGIAMEEAIKTMLEMNFEYEIDGLVFTPRDTGIAPPGDVQGSVWNRVYKWKPASQNSIDFLVKISDEETYDPVLQSMVKKGQLFVSRGPKDDIIYPRETMNGEYKPKPLPESLQRIAEMNTRVPSVFQPSVPRDPDAYQILLPMNDRKITVDKNGNKVEDDTIIECAYDVDTKRWNILRTRYDKTYEYKVKKQPQYGNDSKTAEDNWTSIHIPVTEDMISNFITNPLDQSEEDDMYYRDDLNRNTRVLKDSYDFHNAIKNDLYRQIIKKGDTLLELAVGVAGDFHRWKKTHVGKVVGIDISLSNIISPKKGAAVRYLKDKQDHPQDYRPAILYIVGNMTEYPLLEQEDKYMPIVTGKEKAPTEYLSQFEDIKDFDVISCQFAIHYACETEEVFRNFARNIEKYGKDIFFGTCLDGQAVYSLLVGKKTHLFGNDKQIAGEFTKMYDDKESWVEEFGMPIQVYLENFEKPQIEYLVPFEKVTEIMKEHGYELQETRTFRELYSQQTHITLTDEQQLFSFLHRTFVFKKFEREDEEMPEEQHAEQAVEIPEIENETKSVDTDNPKKRLKKEVSEEEMPILFYGADESKGEYRYLSNMSEHPVDIDGEKFPTVEHYFQAMKAKIFKDDEIYNKIIKAKTPKAAKALGKKVKNFVKDEWDAKRDDFMMTAVRAKFVQHPEIRKKLMETGDKIIGEANARDTYWGIGTGVESDKARFPEKWRGKNKLGHILMNLRKNFIDELTAETGS